MKQLLEQITDVCESFEINAKEQAEKNNKAAGLRARKLSLCIEQMMKQFRKMSVEANKM